MKTPLTLLSFLIFSKFVSAQEYTLVIKIKDAPAGTFAYVQYLGQTGPVSDSIPVEAGTFIMKGKIDEPRPAHFSIRKPSESFKHGNVLHMYIEPGDAVINVETTVSEAKVTGSATTDEMYALNKITYTDRPKTITISGPPTISRSTGQLQATRRTRVNGDRIYTTPSSAPVRLTSASPELASYMASVQAQHKNAVVKFIMANPTSFVSMYALNSLWKQRLIEFTEFYKLLSSLNPGMLKSNHGRVMFPE